MANWKIILLFGIWLSIPAMAQDEIGVFGGATNFYGDVGPDGPTLPRDYAWGVFYRHNFNQHWSWRISINQGRISAEDSLSGEEWVAERNLSFRSTVLEANTTFEFNFWPYRIGDPKLKTFFIFGGIGVNTYNPKAQLNGEWYELRPLGTEGQGTSQSVEQPYGKMALNVPFGIGFKFNIGKYIGVGLESGFRRTYTDYLDDVSTTYVNPVLLAQEKGIIAGLLSDRSISDLPNVNYQRGNANDDDWYLFSGVTVSIKILEGLEKCHEFR